MKKSLILVTAMVLVLTLAGCSQGATPNGSSGPSAPSSSPNSSAQGAPVAADIWGSTISNQSYKSWQTAPGYETTQVAKGPHGKSVQIFVNPATQNALNGSAATNWPTGAVIVKDAYDANSQLMQIEYMQKTDAGWYFASYGADGNVAVEGVKAEPCEACHMKNSSDGVKSFKLPQ